MAAPAPWKIEYSSTGSGSVIGITDANGRDIRASAIGSTTAAEGNLTSEMIVRAVNAHDELVAAADDALNCLIGCCISAGGCDDRKTILDTQMRLRKILAEVGVTYSEAL